MHKSRLAGFIIDCDVDDLDDAAEFWARALGAPAPKKADLSKGPYVEIKMRADEPYAEVQKVDHESRVHLDIEADDIDAEVARLQKLGAKQIEKIKTWVVLEAPTGHRFCVVPVVSSDFADKAHTWDDN